MHTATAGWLRPSPRRWRCRAAGFVSVVLIAVVLAACAAPATRVPDAAPVAAAHHVAWVVRRGWHSGVALRREAVDETGLLPEAADFAAAGLIEFGWGDRDYYMARDASAWLAARAALAPTPAVLHLVPLAGPAVGDGADVIAIPLSDEAFHALVHAIAESFDRSASGTGAVPPYRAVRQGAFYPARGSFHLLNTCNTWTARVLAAAGVDIDPAGVVTADTLMRRLRESEAGRR